MRVTKDMLHPDLKSTYRLTMWLPTLFSLSWLVRLVNYLGRRFHKPKTIEGFHLEERLIPCSDGSGEFRVVIYRPQQAENDLPALLYLHGGGYIMGNPEQAVVLIARFLRQRPCVVIAPDYRKAFSSPFPAGFDDCYDTLVWAKQHASELGIAGEKFMVAGHSAGGGLTAAVSLKARDTGEADIAFQMPIYPMIDDTQPKDPARDIAAPVWNTKTNRIGWGAYLADIHSQKAAVPAYAAPARGADNRGLPPTITFVGTLEPFYWETSDYVQSLRDAGVEVAYREYEGCYHGFDFIGGKAAISQQAIDFTYQQFADFYDRFVAEEQPVSSADGRAAAPDQE
ncbi:MAG: alpha/beta hydrolase [Pseudomonadota bacterium]